MEKINKLCGPGEYLVLKDILVEGYSNVLAEVREDLLTIRYGGIRPRYFVTDKIPAKSIVTIISHDKSYRSGSFVSTIELKCSGDSCFTYTCVIYGNTYDVLEPLSEAGKLLYGKG